MAQRVTTYRCDRCLIRAYTTKDHQPVCGTCQTPMTIDLTASTPYWFGR